MKDIPRKLAVTGAPVTVNMTELATLNEYCLEDLFQLLNVKTQIRVIHLNDYFKRVVQKIWCRRLKIVHLNLHLSGYKIVLPSKEPMALSSDELKLILEAICGDATEVRFSALCEETLSLISQFKFPNVKKLSLTNDIALGDDCVGDLQSMFPNIEALYPKGDFLGVNFYKWQKLKILELHNCPLFRIMNLRKCLNLLDLDRLRLGILRRFTDLKVAEFKKLTSLQEIVVNSTELAWFNSQNIIWLKNVKEFAIIDQTKRKNLTNFKFNIDVQMCKYVTGLEMFYPTAHMVEMLPSKLSDFPNLTTLKLVNNHTAFRKLPDLDNLPPGLRDVLIDGYDIDRCGLMYKILTIPLLEKLSIGMSKLYAVRINLVRNFFSTSDPEKIAFNFYDNFYHLNWLMGTAYMLKVTYSFQDFQAQVTEKRIDKPKYMMRYFFTNVDNLSSMEEDEEEKEE